MFPVVPVVSKLVILTPFPTVLPKVTPPVPEATVKAPAPETSPSKDTRVSVVVRVGEPERVTGPVKVCPPVVVIFCPMEMAPVVPVVARLVKGVAPTTPFKLIPPLPASRTTA